MISNARHAARRAGGTVVITAILGVCGASAAAVSAAPTAASLPSTAAAAPAWVDHGAGLTI